MTDARDLRAFGASDVGRRRTANEDRFHVDLARGIFVVVDGVGGHAAGDKAADTAIAAMVERLERQTGAVGDRLREAITIANNEVHRLAASNPAWRGMACVATAAVVDGSRAVVGHVGDSRLYRLLDGSIEKITPDHSPVGEREDANEMSELEAMHHPRRNEVYRDVGSEPRTVSDPDFVFVAEIDLPQGAALLLCSDGLTDLVPSDTIRSIAATHAGAPELIVRHLIAAANDAGGKDNITAIYVERPAVMKAGVAGGNSASAPATWRIPVALLVVVAALAGLVAGLFLPRDRWPFPRPAGAVDSSEAGIIVVRAEESIAAALAAARPGTSVIVEPGEYRERLSLRDGVRLVSRVPRGATIRLPEGSAEGDAAIVAAGVRHAELTGFRIAGDAVAPLGIGVITRDSAVRIVDLEITGATVTALDLGAGEGVLVSGNHVHDNPGSGLVLRAGAAPRLTNNVFSRNASSDLHSAPVVVEAGATPEWLQNVFTGMTPEAVAGLDAAARAALPRANWFVVPAPAGPAPAARGGRGR